MCSADDEGKEAEEGGPAAKRPRLLPDLPNELRAMQLPAGVTVPRCVLDDFNCRVWHFQDTSFNIPKVCGRAEG
jgi:hypothetical protein